MTDIRAILLNCTLKSSDEPSSTDRLLGEVAGATAMAARNAAHLARALAKNPYPVG